MLQNRYHICVPDANTVKVKRCFAVSVEPDTLTGKFNYKRITPEIQEIIKNSIRLKDEQIQKVGEALFEALFDSQLREDFLFFHKQVVNQHKEVLQVILEINATAIPEVVAYPWELMCLPEIYKRGDIQFATDRKLSFFRCLYQLEKNLILPININQGEKLKIALVISKPTTDADLSKVEYQEVKNYLNSLDKNQVTLLPVIDSLDFLKIVERLEKDKPDIFHFIGHARLIEINGEDVAQIAFVDYFGQADWKDAKEFIQLFSGHMPKIIILQACETGRQSENNAFSSVVFRLMLQGIPVVIAMQFKISNQTANSFAREFYAQIIEGASVEVAVQKARFRLAMNNSGHKKLDFAIPMIYMNSSDGCLFTRETKHDILDMSSNKSKIQSLQMQKQIIKSQIAELEQLINICNQDIAAEFSAVRRLQLNRQIDNYFEESEGLYTKLGEIQEKINRISIS